MDKIENICNLLVYTNIPYREYLGLDKKIRFGCEIEFEKAKYYTIKMNLRKEKILNKWLLKDDATVVTIDNYEVFGGEINSPIMHDYKTCWKELQKACELIKKYNGIVNGRAAAHIHIDSRILKGIPKNIINLIKIWTAYEHVIYRFVYGEDEEERKILFDYAAPVAGYFNETIRDIEKYGFDGDIKKLYYYLFQVTLLNNMNSGISFMHCCGIEENEKNTIEIRCPNGTLNEIIWQNNINFFVRLLEYCASSRYDEEFINKKLQNYKFKRLEEYRNIYFEDALELSNLIFEKEEDKLYFLKQYLKINENNKQIIIEKVKLK